MKERPFHAVKPWFDKYYPALCLFADSLINSSTDAEDLVADVFVRLWRNDPHFEKYINVRAVLYTAVQNACIDYIRKRDRQSQVRQSFLYLIDEPPRDLVTDSLIRAEMIREVYSELQKLPSECRKVMTLYYAEGLDHRAIADLLHITVSTVKNQKARGIRLLKKRLGPSFLFLMLSGFGTLWIAK